MSSERGNHNSRVTKEDLQVREENLVTENWGKAIEKQDPLSAYGIAHSEVVKLRCRWLFRLLECPRSYHSSQDTLLLLRIAGNLEGKRGVFGQIGRELEAEGLVNGVGVRAQNSQIKDPASQPLPISTFWNKANEAVLRKYH